MNQLSFSKRTTSAVSVFACLFIASPTGAPTLTHSVTQIVALQLAYGQLVNVYPLLIHQDTANNAADLDAAIAEAITAVENLNTTIDAMMASGDAHYLLVGMQSVAANALVALQNAQRAE